MKFACYSKRVGVGVFTQIAHSTVFFEEIASI